MISKCYWTVSEDFCIQAETVNDNTVYKVYNGWGEHLATFKSFDAADAFIVQQERLLQNNSVTEEKQ